MALEYFGKVFTVVADKSPLPRFAEDLQKALMKAGHIRNFSKRAARINIPANNVEGC